MGDSMWSTSAQTTIPELFQRRLSDFKITAILAPDASVDEEALFRWCIDQLPYFALPRYIDFRAALPRSPDGRVPKRQLRDEGVTPETWDAEKAGIPYRKR